MYDIITIGSATVDAFVNTGSRLFKRAKQGYVKVPFGSKILVKELRFDVGGGGTNTAVALARLGLRVAFLGKVGVGNNSERVLKLLKKEKVDTSLVQRESGRTGFSIILDAYGHDRTILAFKGSNNDLRLSEIPKKKLNTRWFYFCSMMGDSFKTLKGLAVFAKKRNIKIMFNPSSYMTKEGLGYIKRILSKSSILVLNKEEAGMLTKGNVKKMLKRLYKEGPGIVVITEGNKGASAYDGERFYSVEAHNIKVLETTGAGDAFGAGFLAGIIRKNDVDFALRLGQREAEGVIRHYGAKNNLLKMRV